MADWRLKPRSGRCTRCGAPFTPGGSGFSLLTPDPAGEGYVRHDLCADCHAALPPEARRGASAHLVGKLLERDGELVGGIDLGIEGHLALALMQRLHAIVLLGEVREMEEGGEGTDHHLSLVDGEQVQQLHRMAEGAGARGVGGWNALLVGRLVSGLGSRVAGVGLDHVVEQRIEDGAGVGVILLEHATLQAQEERKAVTQTLG